MSYYRKPRKRKQGGARYRKQGKQGESDVYEAIFDLPITASVIRSASSRPVDLVWIRSEAPRCNLLEVKSWRYDPKRNFMRKEPSQELLKLEKLISGRVYGIFNPSKELQAEGVQQEALEISASLVVVLVTVIRFFDIREVVRLDRMSPAGCVRYPWDLKPWLELPARNRSGGGKGEGGDRQ